MRYSLVIKKKKKMIRETQESEEFDNKFIYMLELLERKICKLIFQQRFWHFISFFLMERKFLRTFL